MALVIGIEADFQAEKCPTCPEFDTCRAGQIVLQNVGADIKEVLGSAYTIRQLRIAELLPKAQEEAAFAEAATRTDGGVTGHALEAAAQDIDMFRDVGVCEAMILSSD